MDEVTVKAAPEPATTDDAPGNDLTGPVIKERYRLFPTQPIVELDQPSVTGLRLLEPSLTLGNFRP